MFSHVQCAMDDGGQRLLDVIEDTHVLETFLRENFSNSGLEDSPRFDNVSSSTDSGLVSSGGLDSFVFDGQLVDPLRGGTSHSSHHPHQVAPHVLQQVLHPPSLSSASALSGGPPHQLHHHQIHHHHQHHHLQQSSILQQHHSQQQQQQQQLQHNQQHQPSHSTLSSPVGGNLEVDCIGRNRDACGGSRNDSEHTLQQLLASAPSLGSSQQILQLHHQSQHQSHPQLQQLVAHSHPQLQPQQHQTQHQNSNVLSPALSTQLPQPNSLIQHQHQHPSQHSRQPQQRQQQQQTHKSQHQQHTQTQDPQTPDISSALLSTGLQPASTISGSCSRLIAQQSPPAQQSHATSIDLPRNASKTQVTNTSIQNPSTKVVVSCISTPSIVQSGGHGITSRVQVVGGHNQILSSAAQLLTPTSQLLPGTQIVQQAGQTQVISGGSILAGGQVLSAPNVLSGGQVLSSMPNGQVFQGGQLIPSAQVLANHLINNSHVITTVGGVATSTAPLYVTPSAIASQIQQAPPSLQPQLQNQLVPSLQNTVSSIVPSTSTSLTLLTSPSSTASTSSFTIPNKSPVSSLPRTSPGPSYPATPSPHHTIPSPASYPSRSPAPSPHAHISTMRSPAPPSSPAINTCVVSNPQSTQAMVSSSGTQQGSTTLVSGVVGSVGMMQGLVPHLPLTQVGGSNGVVITQGGNSMQVTPGIKQMVQGGQLIQLVSSHQTNSSRQPIALPHPKPIQPKQPQLLPKPSQGNCRQPTPPPPGKALIGTRPAPQNNQQPIVLGTSNQQQTVIASQQNLGSFVLNSSLLQAGLQQPILIPQPNGMQLLVRPAGPHSGGAPGQTLLVPVQGQSQVMTSMGKLPQHQTLVIPGSGQTPALVIPQGLAQTLGGGNMLSTTQGGRAPQPIIRFVTPQAPLQLQQINTPNGPMFVAVPVGQTALNLPGVFTTAPNSMRTLAPQVAPGTIQLTSSLGPSTVSLNHIQIPTGNLQSSTTSQSLQLTTSLPSSLPSVITTTPTSRSTLDENLSLSNHHSTQVNLPPQPPPPPQLPQAASAPQQQHLIVDINKSTKKKSKKKKKDKESKEDKGKGKAVSINLNELLKETGIFDENDFGGLGIEDSESSLPVASNHGLLPQSTVPTVNTNPVTCKVSTISNHLLLSNPQPVSSTAMMQSHAPSQTIITSSSNYLGQTSLPSVSTIPTSMCFTFDANGKLVLGSTDMNKSQITAIAGSFPPQVVHSTPLQIMSPSGMNFSSAGTYVFGSSEGNMHTIPVSRATSMPSVGHLVALHQPSNSQYTESIQQTSMMKFDTSHHQLGNEMIKVAQNTQLLHTQTEKHHQSNNSPLLTSLINHPMSMPSVIGVNNGNTDPTISLHLTGNERLNIVSSDGKQFSELNSNGLISTHPSQVPMNNPAVIVSSNLANSFLSGAIINGKTVGVSSHGTDLGSTNSVQTPMHTVNNINVNYQKVMNTQTSNPVSMHIIDSTNKINTYQNQYLASVKTHNIVESKPKKSNKKKKKEKEVDTTHIPYISSGQVFPERTKSTHTHSTNHVGSQASFNPSPILMHNGTINTVADNSVTAIKNEVTLPKIEPPETGTTGTNIHLPVSLGSSSAPSLLPSPNLKGISSLPSVVTVTSNSVVTTTSNLNISTALTVSSSVITTTTNGSNKSSLPISSSTYSNHNSSSGGIVVTGQPVVVQPGQQVKQLLLSPQNQEALKKIHTQIQDLQNKRGMVAEPDKALHQRLIAEYKKIMATGTPVPVSHSSLTHPQYNTTTAAQHNPIKYSHSVGHKKILFTPNQKKGYSQPHHQMKKQLPELHKPADQIKIKDEVTGGDVTSSTTTLSSQPISSVVGFASTTATVTITSPTSLSTSNIISVQGLPSVQPLALAPPKVCESIKIEKEGQRVCGGSICSTLPSESISNGISRNVSSSMPIIMTSTKCVSATSVTSAYSNLNFTGHKVSTPQSSPVTSTANTTPVQVQIPSPKISPSQQVSQQSPGIMLPPPPQQQPPPPSPNQSIVVPLTQHSTQSSNTISPMRSSFSLPLTRDQLFEHQLRTDQNGALNPDYRTPFKSKTDACKRLIRYHVYNDFGPTPNDLIESDNQFEAQGESLIRKFNSMTFKYKSLLLRESMRRHPSSETAMLYRLFIQEEKCNLEKEKIDAKSGKDLHLPPPPSHWLGGEHPPPDPPFPWEENWPFEKVYYVDYRGDEESSHETEKESDYEEEYDFKVASNTKENVEAATWEDELEEECQDEPRLQILMDDETDESRSLSAAEPFTEEAESLPDEDFRLSRSLPIKQYSSCDSDSVGFKGSPVNDFEEGDNVKLDERTSKKRHLSPQGRDNNKSSKICKEPWKSVEYISSANKVRNVNESSFNTNINSSKENGVDDMQLLRTKCSSESCLNRPLEPIEKFNSKSKDHFQDDSPTMDEYYSHNDTESVRLDKYKHDAKKYKSEKERKRHDKTKPNKARFPDKAINRSAKKLKIKLKHDKAVPPLRIRSDDRVGCGTLKLTLKKQEGSGDYYRVGDDPNREYRVEHSEEDEEHAPPNNVGLDDDDDVLDSGRQLRSVSVVLEDCLQPDLKNKKDLEDNRSNDKRNKRLKSHHSQSQLDDEYDINAGRRESSGTTWSSNFVDRWPRPENHNSVHPSGFFYQSQPYALEPSLPSSQSVCVSSPGQKIIHQPSRNSHRFS